jgi:serine phosphatase RsbU (regulator of sigma subunit)
VIVYALLFVLLSLVEACRSSPASPNWRWAGWRSSPAAGWRSGSGGSLFWRVGRRLAFSYFLVGVLPRRAPSAARAARQLPAGRLPARPPHRDGVAELADELESAAIARLLADEPADSIPTLGGRLRAAEYQRGRRVTDDESAPGEWPTWVAEAQEARRRRGDAEALARPFWALADGRLSMAAVAGRPGDGVLVWFEGDLAKALRERTRSWVDLYRHDDPRKLPVTRIQLGRPQLSIRGFWLQQDAEELAEYYRLNPPEAVDSPGWLERPWILWSETTGRAEALADGSAAAEFVTVSLASGPRGLFRSLLSVSDQADSTAWLALVGVAILLSEIWLAAAIMAVFMIVGLSRAVNRLSQATAAIAEGDFSFRIPVKRTDQVGELQRSFNAMAGHLSELVDTAAQKEALDKELDLARRVQRDLLPDLIESASGAELATTFEPSAAIGGDYFDVLRRPGGKLAIVVADVAGHGLAAGLRMAMVKSAIVLLAEEEIDAQGIVTRLRRLLRGRPGERGFITLSFAELTLATGELEITNAGHPPCYLVRRDGTVDEIVLPGLPLGTLPGAPGNGRVPPRPGDAMVWLSDGIPECTSQRRAVRLRRRGARAGRAVRLRRSAARPAARRLRAHCGDAPVQDDRTLVVLRYVPERLGNPSTA